MVDIVELQYATMLSNRLEFFKIKSTNPYKINFRCPICMDSQKSKYKARAWLLEDRSNGGFYFNCFNCHAPIGRLGNFLKQVDPMLYNDFISEKYMNKAKGEVSVLDKTEFKRPVFDMHPLKKIKKLSSLKHDHPAKIYIQNRQIPPEQHYRIHYAPKFMSWINTILPGKFPEIKKEEPRLILPFLDKEGKMFGCSARGFNPNGLRYITIMFYEDKSKIFGLDKVDFSKRYFITEGGFDSLFLSNAVAMAGADGNTTGLKSLENAVYVFDAEPRNREICKRMEKLLKEGQKVCIWPDAVPAKDINEMHLAGMKNIENVIKENTFSGLQGQLKLHSWKKCG